MKHKLPLLEKIWLVSPIAIWFSYRPLLRLGQDASMNFELSFTLLYILLLAVVGLPNAWRARWQLARMPSVQLVSAFMVFSDLSILWSANTKRGVLTFCVMGLLYLIFLTAMAERQRLQKILPTLTKYFIASAVVMSLLSFIQFVAAIWVEPRTALLCGGCSPSQFGFARPNLFTIEPQFFGNILLAPAIILLRRMLKGSYKRQELVSALVILAALFLTLSRGSIFALGAALLVLLVVERPVVKRVAMAGFALLASFVVSLLMQGTAAALNPKISTSFTKAITTSINQLSLGVIDLQKDPAPKTETPANPDTGIVEGIPDSPLLIQPTTQTKTEPNFDGYVEESTNVRLKLSKLAVQSWAKSPGRILFGVGLGGSGVVLREDFPAQVNEHEIVQNEYAEILLEGGLVGAALFVAILGGLFYSLRANKWTWAIIIAFMVQWIFFSGYPNALHLYLIFILLAVYAAVPSRAIE